MRFQPYLTGRASRRRARFGLRRKGAGWTRPYRKGRDQRGLPEVTHETFEVEASTGGAPEGASPAGEENS